VLRDPLFQLFLLVIAVIVYGSLYPFRFFDTRDLAWRLDELFDPRIGSKSDALANLALFAPVGLLGTLLYQQYRPKRPVASVLSVFVLGAFMGVSLQVGQLFVRGRIPSLNDAFWNAAGTLVGSAVALASMRLSRTADRARDRLRRRVSGFPLVLVLSFLAYRLAPFVPSLDWGSIQEGLKPLLLAPQLSFVGLLRSSGGWLLFACSMEGLETYRLRDAALFLAVPLVLGLQVLIDDNGVTASEAAGAAAALALWWALRRSPSRHLLVTILVGAAIVAMELEGATSAAPARPRGVFHWLPFYGFLGGSLLTNVRQLFLKFFFYGGEVYLFTRLGWPLAAAAVVTVGCLFGLEYAQVWIPGRTPEITDPLLALLAAGAFRALEGGGHDVVDRASAPSSRRVDDSSL
jgi:VanZ family protein